MTPLIFLAFAVLLGIIAFLCLRLSQAHEAQSILCRCISDMLRQPRAAEAIAAGTQRELQERGFWRS